MKNQAVFLRIITTSLVLAGLIVSGGTSTVLAQTLSSDISAQMEFSPNTIALQSVSRLTITISNTNVTNGLTGLAYSNTLPAGLFLGNPVDLVQSAGCGGAAITANPGGSSISLSGGNVAAGGSCAITVSVRPTTSGIKTTTLAAGDVTGTIGGTLYSNVNPATAELSVATFDFNAEINKQFDPISITPGDVSRLSVSTYNANSFELTNASWTDDLASVQPGLSIANPPNISTTNCGSTPDVTALAGSTTLSLSNATVPAKVGEINGICTVEVDVTSITPGNLINTIPGGNLNASGNSGTVSNTDPASATINVDNLVPPSVTKAFSPNTIWIGQNSRLSIVIRNNDLSHTLSEVSLSDVLNDPVPHNVVLAGTVNPTLTGCGSSAVLTAVAGTDNLSISGAEINPNSTCTIAVNVTSFTQGEYTNNIPASEVQTRQGVTNASPAQADLNVQAVGLSKSFSPSSVLAGEISALTITLRNPTDTAYTGVALDDVMPGTALFVTGTPTTTCTEGTVSIATTNRADDTVRLTGATIPSGSVALPGICTITAQITSPDTTLDSAYLNTIPAGALSSDIPGFTNVLPASGNLNVKALTIDVVKSFSPSAFQQNGTSTLSITLRNPSNSIIHVTQLIDSLPAGLIPSPGTESTSCTNGQAVAAVGSPSTLTLSGLDASGAQIPAGTITTPGSCTFSVQITGTTAANYTNIIDANSIVSSEGLTNLNSASGTVMIYPTDQGMTNSSKSFTPNIISAGSNSRLRIILRAPADEAITGLNVTDELPANVTISNSATAANSCNGTLTADTGSDTITLTGGNISQGGSCTIDVYVTSSVSGVYTNTINALTQISNDQGQRPPSNLTANLTVSNLTMSKSFYPNQVAPGGRSTLTITLRNTFTSPLINVAITQDNLNTMGGTDFTIADPSNATTTCGGTVIANPGSQVISLSGGSVPSEVSGIAGICTVSVDVLASSSITPLPVTRTNTLYRTNVSGTIQGVGTVIRPVSNATAQLTVSTLILSVVKGFDPLTVFGGSSSTMSVQIINPNNAILTGISFTDNMPTGMYVANPADTSTGTCGGTLTAVPGEGSFIFSGGTLAANKRCTLTLSVTMNVNGNRTNIIPAETLTTFNGVKNSQPAQASLTNLPGVSISKYFSPTSIILGETSLLTIQIKNTGNVALSNLGMVDTLPSGLTIAESPLPLNTCNGNLTADPGSDTITLAVGDISPGPNTTCEISVPVTASAAGSYDNVIGKNVVTTAEGATNTDPATDTLIVNSTPALQFEKSLNVTGSSEAPYTQGDTLAYDLVVTNSGNVPLTGVTINDPSVVMGTCTPLQPASLEPGETLTCAATHILTADDETLGTFTNTATADSNETESVTDVVEVPLNQANILSINKSIITAGPYQLGDTLNYTITVTNIGSGTLNNVGVSDIDMILDACIPSQPAVLNSGDSMTCPASHIVNQTDVDAGSFTNTANADSDETDPATDSVTVEIENNSRLEVFKQVTSNGPYNTIGKIITYDISAINTGDQTLTGVTITDPGTNVTLGACTPTQPATLATGQILSCSASHVVTADDITAGGFSNTAFALSDQTSSVSDTADVITQTPRIELQKTGTVNLGVNTRADAGDTISYIFTVTNIGEVTLNDITLIDIVGGVTISGGPIASLAPSASDSTTFSGAYTLTQADVDAGTIENTAVATGTPTVGNIVSDTDDDEQTLASDAAIELQKTGTLNLNIAAPNAIANSGDTITYAFTVTNTGNVTLTNINLTEDVGGITIIGDPIVSLAPGASNSTSFTGSYVLTQADVDAGTFSNTATVTGTPPTGSDVTDPDDDTQTITPVPSINLVKTGTLDLGNNNRADEGDTITYAFTVTNTGNVTLTNVTLTDTVGGITINGGPIASLAPGASNSTTFTGTYTLSQTDLDAATFTNTATVSGTTPAGGSVDDSDDDTQTLDPDPSVELQKVGTLNDGANGEPDEGETITYVFTVTNTGNVTLTNLIITETVGDITFVGSPIASLEPGQSNNTSYTGSYKLTQADIDSGSFTNTAEVSGTAPDDSQVTDSDGDDQVLIDSPGIELEKTGTVNMDVVEPDNRIDAGDTITYTFTVTNSGNVTLTDISLADTVGGITLAGDPIASLAPDESDSTTFTGSYTITQADIDSGTFTNTAEVTGTPPEGEDATDTDDDTQTLTGVARIGVAKRVIDTPVEVSPGVWDITFEILVRNYGNVTLSSLQITDDLSTIFLLDSPFTIQSLSSDDLSVNADYDGDADTDLLDGADSLEVGEHGSLVLVIRVTPANGGPFNNTSVGRAETPSEYPVTDDSHDGSDPDPDENLDPTDNNDPTPIDFGPNLFDPPFGIKTFDDEELPILLWTLEWINNTNIVNINARVYDPIPLGSVYELTGIPSGTGVPLGAPLGSTDDGVNCSEGSSTKTTTTWCYYEGPTVTYPRGRIVWEGVLGPDLGITDPALAVNKITITFGISVEEGEYEINNRATVDVDLDGDGDYEGFPELEAAEAIEIWSNWPDKLPDTGFAPGRITDLSDRLFVNYDSEQDLMLEIPKLDVSVPVLGVPIFHGEWNLDWLGGNAGYLENTAFPTHAGNSGITAHVYDAYGNPGPFIDLATLKWGDEVIIHFGGLSYVYEVREVKRYLNADDSSILQSEDYPWVTLITCQGYNEATDSYRWRVAVRAVQTRIE